MCLLKDIHERKIEWNKTRKTNQCPSIGSHGHHRPTSCLSLWPDIPKKGAKSKPQVGAFHFKMNIDDRHKEGEEEGYERNTPQPENKTKQHDRFMKIDLVGFSLFTE